MRAIESAGALVPGTTVHRFELAGLGRAPFRLLRVEERVHVNADGTTRAGASCDYCATCIRWAYVIQSADGRCSKVGCDCVYKTGDAGLMRVVSRAEANLRRAQSAKRKAARITKAASEAEDKFGDMLARLDAIAARAADGSFARTFAADVATRIRSGKATLVSPAQERLIGRLERETA